MNREAFEEMFEQYWTRLRDLFTAGSPLYYSPIVGNRRRVEAISERDIKLRETTPRASWSEASKATLREDFWKLCSDPLVSTDGVKLLRARHRITKLMEFKRAMFNEFAEFGNLGIAIERASVVDGLPAEVYQPTADWAVLEKRTLRLVKNGLESIPLGNPQPFRMMSEHTVFVRDPKVRAWVLLKSGGRCQACGDMGYETDDGSRFLHVHHMLPLSDGGPDVTDNAVAVCETCHGKLHRWRERHELRSALYGRLPQLKEYPASTHRL
jgi:5-methylcytosine-specific restriction protein A